MFRLVFILFLLLLSLKPILASEVTATKLDLQAEEAERRGDTRKADLLRFRASTLRKYQFAPYRDGYIGVSKEEREKNLPEAVRFGQTEFLGGSFEIGFRFISSGAFFYPGKEWATEDGAVAFQGNSFYKPRGAVGYQNIEPLPFSNEPEGTGAKRNGFTPKILYKHNSKKWGLEYTNIPFQSSYDYSSFGLVTIPQYAYHDSRFRLADHKFVVKVYDELTKDKWFSWDFGLRLGQIKTNTAYSSNTLGETRFANDTTNFVAASAGFKFYHSIVDYFSYEVGGDLFLTPLGSLRYNRTVLKEAGSLDLIRSAYLEGDEVYSITSKKSLQTDIVGLDLLGQVNFIPIEGHKLSLGLQLVQYSFRANESKTPNIQAFSEAGYLAGYRDYYLNSGFYEADGKENRPTRMYSLSNLYFGYSYVF